MYFFNRIISIVFFIIVFYFFVVGDENYPKPENKYINDYANILTELDENNLIKKLKAVDINNKVEITILTINSISEYTAEYVTIESFATNLFNHWGIGDKDKNSGVLILVSLKERQCRIELGSGYTNIYDVKMKRIIDNEMIPYFKNGSYSNGIYNGVNAVINEVTRELSWGEKYGGMIISFLILVFLILLIVSFFKKGKSGWAWVLLSILGIILLFLLRGGRSKGGGFGGGSSSGGGASGGW